MTDLISAEKLKSLLRKEQWCSEDVVQWVIDVDTLLDAIQSGELRPLVSVEKRLPIVIKAEHDKADSNI